jgi:hypothetical protein
MALARCVHRALQRRGHACCAHATWSDAPAQSAMARPLQQDSQLAACDTAPCAASRGSMRFSTATPVSEQHQALPTLTCHDASPAHSSTLPWRQGLVSSSISRQSSSFADALLPAAWQKGSHSALNCHGPLKGRHAAAAASLVQPQRSICAGAEAQRAPAAYCINVYTGKAAASHLAAITGHFCRWSAPLHCTLTHEAMVGSADCPNGGTTKVGQFHNNQRRQCWCRGCAGCWQPHACGAAAHWLRGRV